MAAQVFSGEKRAAISDWLPNWCTAFETMRQHRHKYLIFSSLSLP
jgi:hypothetical protein